MYQQSNTSAPAFDHSPASTQGPPLADDLGYAFDRMKLAHPETLAGEHSRMRGHPSRSATSGPQSASNPGAASHSHVGSASGSVDRANAMYAQQEIHQSASEVRDEDSLAAIADSVEATAAELRQGTVTPSPRAQQQHQQGQSTQQYYQGGSLPYQQSSMYGGGGPQWGGHQQQGDWQQQQQQQGFHPQGYPSQSPGYPMQGAPWNNVPYMQDGSAGYYPSSDVGSSVGYDASGPSNPYLAAAQTYGLDYPGSAASSVPSTSPHLSRNPSGGSPGQFSMTPISGAAGMAPPPQLYRQGTAFSVGSSHSGSGVNMSSAARRRKSKDVNQPQQTLPFNKEFVIEYRARMKADPDPEEQFRYARYLVEAAKKVQDSNDGPKQARKYRDSLLSESLKLIKKLATTGMGNGKPPYAEAQFFLANCFGNGSLGLQVDHEKAYNLYVQASKQNHPAATYRTAVCNEVGAGTRRDHHRAVLFYRKASALGDTAGMYKLGMILLNGLLGQARNVREAIVWLKRAAGQADEDNPHALHELGLLHEKPNNVVPHDEAYSRELFTQAAQLGYAPSQFKLGSAYEYGALTCPVDPRRSIAWYTKAAGKNDGESELALSGWYLTGSEGVLKQSDSEAYLWARRAATKGIPKAEYAVGYYSEVGIGVKADLEEAKRWYMRAAAQGNKRAMQRLTELKNMGSKAGKARPTRKDAEKECVVM